jgi:Ca-activated chloride channel family protein
MMPGPASAAAKMPAAEQPAEQPEPGMEEVAGQAREPRMAAGAGVSVSGRLEDEAGARLAIGNRDRDKQTDRIYGYFSSALPRLGLKAATPGTEQYEPIRENDFLPAATQPLSTFAIDVDTASYANVRRFLTSGRLPPPDAVRIEEMVNYFPYDYPPPDDGQPFSVKLEVAQCPWNPGHRLVRIGLKGKPVEPQQRGPSNLVFLLDVSGSMSDPEKLPLVKQAMSLLVDQLTEDDRVAIVTYAGEAGLRLESTNAANKGKILDTIQSLSAGGSTHGSAGIQLAYEQATEHFIPGGTNRVILATDGDLNVGITDDDQLVRLIQRKAQSGVFLTVLGFGTGNLKDSKLEKLADKGNGVYAYIDSLREAHRVLVEQLSGNLVTIAKDVKVQVEFNPAAVARYRLIGFENRALAAEDFANDRKDAGEIGAGHSATALYEIVPARDEGADLLAGQSLRYQRRPSPELTEAAGTGELLTVKLRYQEPDGRKSKLLEFPLADSSSRFAGASHDFRFAASVAAFGMLLRGSRHAGEATLAAVEEYAASAVGEDPYGYRAEFLDLVRRARQLAGN